MQISVNYETQGARITRGAISCKIDCKREGEKRGKKADLCEKKTRGWGGWRWYHVVQQGVRKMFSRALSMEEPKWRF